MSDIPNTTPAPTSNGGAPSTPEPTSTPATETGGASSTGGTTTNTNTSTGNAPAEGLKKQIAGDPVTPPQPGDRPQTEAQKEAERREVQRLKFRLKVDGEEIEEELDEHELTIRLQKGLAADKRFREAAQRTREINELIEKAKSDPDAFLKHLGLDPIEYAERKLERELERAQMTPEQVELEEARQRLQEYEQRERQLKEEQERRQWAEYEKQIQAEVEQDFLQALDELGWEDKQLERSVLLPLMADIAITNEQYGTGLTPQQLARAAENRLNAIAQRPLTTLKGERLLKFVGEAATKEIIRASLERTRKAAQNEPVPQPKVPQQAPRTEPPPRDKGNFFIRNVLGGM